MGASVNSGTVQLDALQRAVCLDLAPESEGLNGEPWTFRAQACQGAICRSHQLAVTPTLAGTGER
jgi:hypothetical protein